MKRNPKKHQEKLEAQLDQWSATVALYAARAENAPEEDKMRFFEITAALQRMQDEVRMKLACKP
jgi:hypothetical protein